MRTMIICGAMCAAPATWWLLGDLSERAPDAEAVVDAPTIGRSVEQWIGALGAAATVGTIGLLIVLVDRNPGNRRLLWPSACLVAAGAFVGLAGRVVTARTVGANIGGGMALLLGVPVLAVLVLYGVRTLKRST